MGLVNVEWGWDSRADLERPSHFLVYDQITFSTYSTYFRSSELCVDYIKNSYLPPHSQCNNSYRVSVAKLNKNYANSRLKVLVLLQWGYDGEIEAFNDIVSNGLYPDELEALINETQGSLFWIFKLHPVHIALKNKYKKHFSLLKHISLNYSNIDWELASYSPISEVILSSDICITLSSSAAYDAATYGRKTFALCPLQRAGCANCAWFPDLKIQGLLVVLKDCKELKSALENNVKSHVPIQLNTDSPDAYAKIASILRDKF
jgi:hypothetical protein